MKNMNRREFIRQGGCAALGTTGLAATLANLRLVNAAVASQSAMSGTGDYKALVCVFLYGGNDAFNLLVPRGPDYPEYAAVRGTLAVPEAEILPITPATYQDGRQYGLHPAMAPLAPRFNPAEPTGPKPLAILANVGTLIAPITKAEYQAQSVAVPPQLFSHSDQQVQWQTSVSAETSTTGWGGRMADVTDALNQNPQVSMSISLAGYNLFQVGGMISQYHVNPYSGTVGLGAPGLPPAAYQHLGSVETNLHGAFSNVLEAAFAGISLRAVTADRLISDSLDNLPPLATVFPTTALGAQLSMAARLIAMRDLVGLRRQIIFCAVGGYDTHFEQVAAHQALFAELSGGLAAFYDATVELGVDQDATLFTVSDFGRTYTSNGRGTDHGWGNHQLVLGGAVQGGDIYGQVPNLTVNGPDDTGAGRWIPTTSVDEYAGTLARWFGVAESDLSIVVPNLGRFVTPDLGFMG